MPSVWLLRDDPDSYSAPTFVNWEADVDYSLMKGVRRLSNWRPIAVSIEAQAGLPLADLSALQSGTPVFNRRAIEVLRPVIGESVELLPLSLREYFVVNVVEVMDCLDVHRSKFSYNEHARIITAVHHYEFDLTKLRDDVHIFKIPQIVTRRVFVSDSFRRLVEAHGLVGADFVPLA